MNYKGFVMKKLLTILGLCLLVGIGLFFAYRVREIYFSMPHMLGAERERIRNRENETLKSIFIVNDMGGSNVFAEFMRDGQLMDAEILINGNIGRTQGKVRIFVPEKKGWYSVEYEYPYPLTKRKEILADMYERRFIIVNLSSLINSVTSGEVEYSVGWPQEGGEKGTVKDIKVVFEPGEGPKK